MRPFTTCTLTKGQIALYDLEDAYKIIGRKWQAKWNPHTKSYYAVSGIKTVLMSRIIMGLESGDKRKADHINHDTLDNRKDNLRIVTTQQNSQNIRGVKGYSWNKKLKKWRSMICVNYKLIHLGYFRTEGEASEAYIKARKEYGFIN